jgi:hypothetical protein
MEIVFLKLCPPALIINDSSAIRDGIRIQELL